MESLRLLTQTRSRLKANISRLLTVAANPPAGYSPDLIDAWLGRLNTAWAEFEQVGDRMVMCDEEEGYVDSLTDDMKYEEKYMKAIALFTSLKRSLEPNTSKIEATTTKTTARENELPKVQIKEFGGDYKEWPAFKDIYESTIHNKAYLSKTQKFHYLKTFLTAEASNLIRHISITEAAYETAWARLNERYNSPRHIVNSLLDTFMSLPSTIKLDVSALRRVSDGANEIIRGLDAIGATGRDCWIIYMILAKVDIETRRKWAEEGRADSSPTVEDLFKFLDARCEQFELSQRSVDALPRVATANDNKSRQAFRTFVTTDPGNCQKCNTFDHNLYRCPEFLDMSEDQRRAFVKDKQLCFNCLKSGHLSNVCGSEFCCKRCNGRHHTLIHSGGATLQATEDQRRPISDTSQAETQGTVHTSLLVMNDITYPSHAAATTPVREPKKGTLPTALVQVRNARGTYSTCRVLIDSGSELSYISERCAMALGLTRHPSRILVSGISSVKAETTRGFSTLHIKSKISHHELEVKAHVLGKITSALARDNIDASALAAFEGVQLADSNFTSTSPVDILLGVDHVWTVFTGNKMYDSAGNIIAVSSIFGWVVTSVAAPPPSTTITLMSIIDIDKSLQRFWEIEDDTLDTHQDPENDKVENHFLNTHSRDANGRYIVELPFKTPNVEFADTLKGAMARFAAVERRLRGDVSLQSKYIQFMQDYIRLGHMEEKQPNEDTDPSKRIFYMPHHPVIGQKLRIVFDGSYEDSTGRALNNELHIGPNLQRNLLAVCLRFRMHKFVFSADVVKMFRQIWVTNRHRDYQRIVWRENPSKPLKHYKLTTVNYGTACAPFLAGRVLQQLATDHQGQFPDAANTVWNDFYVDDVLTGANTEEELLQRRDELIRLLACGRLELAKWASNSKYILDNDTSQQQHILGIEQDTLVKVLGIHWHPGEDNLLYKVTPSLNPTSTKRQVLSDVSRIFDPLGLLAPIVVQFKILFQELWLHNLSWDSELPPKLADLWKKYRADLVELKRFKLPRSIENDIEDIELYAFSDASIKAYAAVVYSRIIRKDGTISVSLIAAKTLVAPLKQQTLPRLELCGALLLRRLIRTIKSSLHHKKISIYAWCDATIILSWLSHSPSKLKTFVGNRTAEILETIPRNAWHYMNTKDNPADCASRGMLAANLINHNLWWKGPSWLHDEVLYHTMRCKSQWSNCTPDPYTADELRTTALTTLEDTSTWSPLSKLLARVSSWPKLVRITAYILRFSKRKGHPQSIKRSTSLTFDEMNASRAICLRYAQACFEDDRRRLLRNQPLKLSSRLQTLAPVVLKDDLLHVGGRLENSQLDADVKHPIILPKGHRITKLILEYEHKINLHPGVSALFVIVRQRHWIIGARNMIRKLTHDCLKCFRQRQHVNQQYMANLPAVRVTQAFAFENTGCDYAGPILLKVHRGRNPRKEKGYICLFVCLATSALHLELATDLSTETFLAVFRRFISRRGPCKHIYSDNGQNFIGANRALNEMQRLLTSTSHNDIVSQTLAIQGIKWHFIPPHAPHWGGKWESAVRSVKLHLRRVVGNATLTFEQMHTLLAQIEAVVNSRPLFATSDTDTSYLSPAHLLIGRPYTTVPEGDLRCVPENRLDYWQQTQSMLQGFWKRWHQEYLTSLQQRPKWTKKFHNIEVGSIVLIKDSNTPPSSWPLARVTEVYPGKDGLVRSVKLHTPIPRFASGLRSRKARRKLKRRKVN